MTWDDDEAERIGPYRIVQRLGEGGMGIVYLALDRSGRAVALKELRPHIAADTGSRVRLAREVETLRRVRSPHVAPIIDADVVGERPYVVTKYVPGHTLDDLVAEHGPLPPAGVHQLAAGLAEALHAIHQVDVVHRDLKPTNILLVDGEPVLIDFGIAHVAGDSRLTATGLVMGTPGYLAPELVDGGEVTPATDWWGWAATVTFAAAGGPPFGRGGMDVVIARVMRGEPQLDAVDPRIAPLLYAALSPRPQDRPHHDQIVAALARYAHGASVTDVIEVPRPSPQPVPAQVPALPPTAVIPTSVPPNPVIAVRPMPAQLPTQAPMPVPAPMPMPAPLPAPMPTRPASSLPPPPPRPRGEADVAGIPTPAIGTDPRIGLADRQGVLLAVSTFLVGLGAAAPLAALGLLGVLMLLSRTVDRVITGVVIRRHTRGHREREALIAAATSPWHLLVALGATALAMVLPVLVGACGVLATSLAVGGAGWADRDRLVLGLAIGGALALLTAWWGPGGVSFRRGARSMARGLAPEGTGTQVVLALLLVGAVACVAWSWTRGGPVWAPLSGVPEVFATSSVSP